jgi:hypothetical protein
MKGKRDGRRIRGTVAITTNIDAVNLAAFVHYYDKIGVPINCSQLIATCIRREVKSLVAQGLTQLPSTREAAIIILQKYGVAMRRRTEVATLTEEDGKEEITLDEDIEKRIAEGAKQAVEIMKGEQTT